jgi:3D (Asp-Asp-Asp) domain-containing protein
LALTVAAALTLPGAALGAEAFYGVTQDNRLVTFQSDNVTNVEPSRAITGLASGDAVVGIDARPVNGQLYALGKTSRLYVINPRTGAARLVGAGPFTPALAGTNFGFDFNPTVDRIRVTSDAEQNLRLNPDDGTVAGVDTNLAYAAGDPGAGTVPNVVATAYTNSFPGATSTTLYNIDNARHALVIQNPPNNGTLTTVGALGNSNNAVAFDIGDGNVGYAVLTEQRGQGLYRIDLSNGHATRLTNFFIGTDQPLVGLAAVGTVPDDTTAPDESIALSSTQLRERLLAVGVRMSVACDEACTASAAVSYAGRPSGLNGAVVRGGPGRATLTVALNARTRAAIRRANVRLTVRITVLDGAGNRSRQTRVLRSQTLGQRRG